MSHLYVLKLPDNKIKVGKSTDITARLLQHKRVLQPMSYHSIDLGEVSAEDLSRAEAKLIEVTSDILKPSQPYSEVFDGDLTEQQIDFALCKSAFYAYNKFGVIDEFLKGASVRTTEVAKMLDIKHNDVMRTVDNLLKDYPGISAEGLEKVTLTTSSYKGQSYTLGELSTEVFLLLIPRFTSKKARSLHLLLTRRLSSVLLTRQT